MRTSALQWSIRRDRLQRLIPKFSACLDALYASVRAAKDAVQAEERSAVRTSDETRPSDKTKPRDATSQSRAAMMEVERLRGEDGMGGAEQELRRLRVAMPVPTLATVDRGPSGCEVSAADAVAMAECELAMFEGEMQLKERILALLAAGADALPGVERGELETAWAQTPFVDRRLMEEYARRWAINDALAGKLDSALSAAR
jgi:hypothetical protein